MKPGNIILVAISALFGLLCVELFLNHFANRNSRPVLFGDHREWLHALYDLRVADVPAYPIMSAEVYSQTFLDRGNDKALLPLAGIGFTPTTFCNELGQFIVYRSDRHGFRNDDQLWRQAPQILLIGDSFAQGACVPDGETIAARLIGRGRPTLNLGYNANGPLVELATLIEYGPAIRPRQVAWLYHEGNDLTDLGRELDVPVLRKYLDAGFRQDLINRQGEIDRTIRTALDTRPELQAVAAAAREHWSLTGLASLRNVRAQVGNGWQRWVSRNDPPGKPEFDDAVITPAAAQRLADFRIVLGRARDVAASWGGAIHFVYLPASERYRFPQLAGIEGLDRTKAEVLKIVANLGLAVIDLGPAITAAPQPERLYPKADWPVHMTPDGYRLIADAIAARLPVLERR